MAASPDVSAAPNISVADAAQDEGNSGYSVMDFPVSLAEPTSYDLRVSWYTVAGTAVEMDDYLMGQGVVLIPEGSSTATISVLISGDVAAEDDETFFVYFQEEIPPAPADRSLAQFATGTILDDDGLPSSDLAITNASSPGPVPVGQDVTYDINVSNNGPDTATSVEITDQIDETLVLKSATASISCGPDARLDCKPSAFTCEYVTTVTCLVGSLAPGSTATATVVARTTRTGELSNLAAVSSSTADPDEENNSDQNGNDVVADEFGCTIVGSNDAETIEGTGSGDVICGRGGDDIIFGGAGDDELRGGAGNDTLHPGDGTDLVIGWSGDDTFFSSPGTDTFDAGGGWDTVNYAYDPAPMTMDLRSGIATDGFNDTDTVSSVGGIRGSEFSDVLHGSDRPDVLDGGNGDDSLYGHGGNDTLTGDADIDSVFGNKGKDTCEAESVTSCEA